MSDNSELMNEIATALIILGVVVAVNYGGKKLVEKWSIRRLRKATENLVVPAP